MIADKVDKWLEANNDDEPVWRARGDIIELIQSVIADMNAAIEKQPWCPCCGYDGLWPRGSQGEQGWKEFLASL